MAHVGETIEHPLTGSGSFFAISATTGGKKLRIAVEMAPGGALRAPTPTPSRRTVRDYGWPGADETLRKDIGP